MADARTSGTATERIYSLVKVMGEDPAFAYQKKLNGNIQMYTKSGAGGAMPIATGQCGSGIFYIVDALDIQQQGYPVVITYPKDGVSYGIEATGIVKGAKNMDAPRSLSTGLQARNLLTSSLQTRSTTFRLVPTLRQAIRCLISPRST